MTTQHAPARIARATAHARSLRRLAQAETLEGGQRRARSVLAQARRLERRARHESRDQDR